MKLSLAFHIVGLVFWVGGLLFLTRFMKILSEMDQIPERTKRSVQMNWRAIILPGFVMMLLSGLYQISLQGMAFYMQQGWFHTKLTLVLVLIGITFFTGLQVQRFCNGTRPNLKLLSAMHGITGLCLFAIVFLTMLR